MQREDAVWYYRLGGQTLGPVSWIEVEELTRDTVDAGDLLVAQGGDPTWRSAADVLAAQPELAAPVEAPAEPAAPAVTETVETTGDWAAFEEPEPAAPAPVAIPLDRPAPVQQPGGAFAPVHGLGQWITQAWEMVTGELATFVLGMLLAGLVTIVTVGICGPPLQAGLFIMALKRYRGEEITPGTVFEGFQYFLPAWGVVLVLALITGAISAPLTVPSAMMTQQADNPELVQLLSGLAQTWSSIVGILAGAAFFYAMVLVVDRNMGTIAALQTSWEKTKASFLSYVGIVFVLQLVGGAGVLACCVGLLVTAPMVPCAQVAAYMYHFRGR